MPKILKTDDGNDYMPIIFDTAGRILPIFQSLAEVTLHVLTYGGTVHIPAHVMKEERLYYQNNIAPLIEEGRRIHREGQHQLEGMMIK